MLRLPYPLTFADARRAHQVTSIGSALRKSNTVVQSDRDGYDWAIIDCGGWYIGWSILGSGRHYDRVARERWPDAHEEACCRALAMTSEQKELVLHEKRRLLRFGELTERMFWLIHAQAIIQRQSTVRIAAPILREILWGATKVAHWRSESRSVLETLSQLHICNEAEPVFGDHTSLVTHFRVPRRGRTDDCPDGCVMQAHSGFETDSPHEHVMVTLGRGMLGCVEEFGQESGSHGIRHYQFHSHDDSNEETRRKDLLQRRIGRTGQLTQIYLPALLGSNRGQELPSRPALAVLQALIRETTRAKRTKRGAPSEAEAINEGKVPPVATNQKGKQVPLIVCPFLMATETYIGFNGNQARKGRGYKLSTWCQKAGIENMTLLLSILDDLRSLLSLTISAISPSRGTWSDFDELKLLTATRPRVASGYHVRVYTKADYQERWNSVFGWPVCGEKVPALRPVDRLNGIIASHRLKQADVAIELGIDPSTLSKILTGKRRYQEGMLEAVEQMAARPVITSPAVTDGVENLLPPTATQITTGDTVHRPVLEVVHAYLDAGWSVIPQLTGAKRPTIRWKEFQSRVPTEAEVGAWWRTWTDAGVMLVLGPTSNVFSIDVDGEEAHNELCRRLGSVPRTLTVKSGSTDPFRYHLHFQHPDIATRAKATPWHPKLEFRGQGGLIVLPPSRHTSGRTYSWAEHCSPDQMTLAPLPAAVLSQLSSLQRRPVSATATQIHVDSNLAASPDTLRFLRGEFVNGPSWNQRLFQAACDLQSRGVTVQDATPLLVTGAMPWNESERQAALRTIDSAYAQERDRCYS